MTSRHPIADTLWKLLVASQSNVEQGSSIRVNKISGILLVTWAAATFNRSLPRVPLYTLSVKGEFLDSKTPEESNNSNWKVHLDPVLREKSDFIIAIKLDPLDDDNLDVWEQMWAKRLSENRFSLCCIPFFAYHLALGDEVETDKDFNIIARVKPSGHLTYRVWFDDPWNKDIRYNVLEHCDRIGLLTESYSYNLLGISAASPIAAESIYAFLRLCESQGLLDFEAGF